MLAWEEVDGTIVVKTAVAEYRAPRLVITAGPWAAALVPAFRTLARPERQVLLWAQPRRPEHFKVGVFPVFNMETPEGHFYGYPVYGNPGFKIGKYHHRLEEVNPDHMDRGCYPEDEAVVRAGIRRYFPDADGPTMGLKTCLSITTATTSPRGPDAIRRDRLPRSPCLASGGCSSDPESE